MPQISPQLLGLVLCILRQMVRWNQGRLERAAGLSQGAVSRMEHGENIDRRKLDRLATILGFAPGRVQGMINGLAHNFATRAATGSPSDLTFDQQQILEQTGTSMAAKATERLGRKFHVSRWRADRAAASAAWQRLRKTLEDDRLHLIEAASDFQTWAVVERLCEESAKAASNDVEEAAHLAALARCAAAKTRGAVGYQTWLAGYAAAFEGNARMVSGDLLQARQVFVDAEAQLQAGIPIEPMDRSRPLHLYAVLLNYRGELDAALAKADRALALAQTSRQKARILINRASVLKRRLNFRAALDTLAEARRLTKGPDEPRLGWAINFNEASYLLEAGDADQAASRLDALRTEALKLGRTLDLVRLRWLAGRVASSQGTLPEASSLLREVWGDLADRRLWLDAALAVLELASVELERGLTRDARGLATASAYVFAAQTLPAELLASIRLFWEAVRQETASAQEARDLVQALRRSGGGDAEAA